MKQIVYVPIAEFILEILLIKQIASSDDMQSSFNF